MPVQGIEGASKVGGEAVGRRWIACSGKIF